MKTEKIMIEGMSCSHCTASVCNALKAVNGVTEADVRLKEKAAYVTYDESAVSLDTLKATVTELGFDVVEG